VGVALGATASDLSLSEDEIARVVTGFEDVVRNRIQSRALAVPPTVSAAGRPKLLLHRDKAEKVFLALSGDPRYSKIGSAALAMVVNKGDSRPGTKRQTLQTVVTGRLVDGQEFDRVSFEGASSQDIGRLVPCVRDTIDAGLLHVGGEVRIFCMAVSAFGDFGFPPLVHPGMGVVFDLQLKVKS
jgi:hypothetical protein